MNATSRRRPSGQFGHFNPSISRTRARSCAQVRFDLCRAGKSGISGSASHPPTTTDRPVEPAGLGERLGRSDPRRTRPQTPARVGLPHPAQTGGRCMRGRTLGPCRKMGATGCNDNSGIRAARVPARSPHIQEGPQLLLHESRQLPSARLRSLDEGLKVLLEHAIEHGLPGAARSVGGAGECESWEHADKRGGTGRAGVHWAAARAASRGRRTRGRGVSRRDLVRYPG